MEKNTIDDMSGFQAVILAGGLGTRLGAMTRQIPKPMIPVHGRPFLQYQLELIRNGGFRNVVILTGYLGEQIEEFFEDGFSLGLSLTYSREEYALGTAGCLKNAQNKIKGDFMLLNADTYFNMDYHKAGLNFLSGSKIGMVVVTDHAFHARTFNVKLDEKNSIIGYNKHHSFQMTHKDAGLGFYHRDILDLIPEKTRYSLEEDLYPRLIAAKHLEGYVLHEKFFDMGTPDGLRMTMEQLL